MGIASWLGIGKDIAAPIKAVSNLYTTDKARIEAETKFQEALEKPREAQLENNKLMILSGKVFEFGWIALIGWSCGLLILLFYAPQIIITTYVWAKLCLLSNECKPFPMKADELINLVYLLLGMGGIGIFKNKIS